MTLICFVIWVTFCVAVGIAASRRYARCGFCWSVLSFFISPLLSFFLLVILGVKPAPWQPQSYSEHDWTISVDVDRISEAEDLLHELAQTEGSYR
jgi:hypothetical protein